MLRQFQLIAGETGTSCLAKSRRRQDKDNGKEMPVPITVGIIILFIAVLVCAGLVAIPLWTALFSG
jgi:hypothetical protein